MVKSSSRGQLSPSRAGCGAVRQLVASEPAKARTTALFVQGLQNRNPLELDLGDRIGAL